MCKCPHSIELKSESISNLSFEGKFDGCLMGMTVTEELVKCVENQWVAATLELWSFVSMLLLFKIVKQTTCVGRTTYIYYYSD